MTSKVNKVVIAGRDAALWLTATALMRALGRTGLSIEVVELPTLLRPHDVYMTLPALGSFHELLGLKEKDILKAASGVYTLGQSFANFSRSQPAFFNAYGTHGTQINNIPFLQVWLKARLGGLKVGFEDFSLNTVAAKNGRFFMPTAETGELGASGFAVHLKAQPYAQLLKEAAVRLGVSVRSSRFVEAKLDDTGYVTALALGDGSLMEGDLFIDTTGRESQLLGGALKVGFDSWRTWFTCDRILSVAADPMRTVPAYSQVRALKPGCLHFAPVRDLTGLTFAFNSARSTDDEALQTAAVVSNMRLHPDAVVDELEPGRRSLAWDKNVIAIGEAACVFDPMDNLGLHAVQLGLAHLISLFPLDVRQPWEREEYNRLITSHFERARDLQIAHYKLNQNFDQPFWDSCRAMPVPDTLAWKIELFRARGVVPVYDDETFDTDNWEAVLLGHGVMPETYDPLVDELPEEALMQRFRQMLGFIQTQVQGMKPHDAWLKDLGAKSYA